MAALPKAIPLDTPAEHFDYLHSAAHGVVIVWEKATGGKSGTWHKLHPGDPHIPAVLAAQKSQKDRFIAVNEFHGWRLVRLIKSLRALYVDLDGCTDLQAVYEVLEDAHLLDPSLVVYSGRGMHLYWQHGPVPAAALPVWQRCQDTLIKALKPLGADPSAKDCTRVLRIAGSINSRSSTAVRGVVLHPEPYDFRILCDEILGVRKPQPKPAEIRDFGAAKAATRGDRPRSGSIYDRWHLVYRDLLQIAEWHFLGGIPEGHRNDWLFLSAVALSWFAHPATLRTELEKQAKVWTPGLTLPEIRSALQTPLERAAQAAEGKTFHWQGKECDPRYKFRRETLFEWMQPIIPQQLLPQLRAILPDEVRKENKKETDRKHEETRDRVEEGRYKSHQRGRGDRLLEKPWEALGISRRTWYRREQEKNDPIS